VTKVHDVEAPIGKDNFLFLEFPQGQLRFQLIGGEYFFLNQV